MKLVKQLVEQKLKKYEEALMNDEYNFWDFYMAYDIASVVINKKVDTGIKNKLLKQIGLGKNIDNNKIILKSMIATDMNRIHEFLNFVENQVNKEVAYTDIYTPKQGIIGILDFDME